MEEYNSTTVLAKLDNEYEFNEQYKLNMLSVDKIICFGSNRDGIIKPWQSAFFGRWAENSDTVIEGIEERSGDLIGLK